MAYQTGGAGSGPGGRSLKTPKPRQKPQLPQPVNAESGSPAPYDFYRTGTNNGAGATGGFLPQQPNSTKAASGYAQQIQSGRNTFHQSNSQTRADASSAQANASTVPGQQQQNPARESAQRPPTVNSIYHAQGQPMRHNARKQAVQRSDQKGSQSNAYQRPQMHDASNPTQFSQAQQRDLRKIRDESTQGSRSRAPNFQLYQNNPNNQGGSFTQTGQQPATAQGAGRALSREERGRGNQHHPS